MSVLEISELFVSIAGESTQAGRPATFVRLSGCNLRCRWCDTERAFLPGRRVPTSTLAAAIAPLPQRLVVITGGEPLLQPEVGPLAEMLLGAGKQVMVETNGSRPIDLLPPGAIAVVDMKPPSSGENASMDLDNLGRLRPSDELKLVIADRRDFEWARGLLADYPIEAAVLFSPAMPHLPAGTLADWILAAELDVRLQIQLHKVLWPSGRDGTPLDLPAPAK